MENIFIPLGKFFFKYRNSLFPVVYVCLILLVRPGLFLNDPQLDTYVSTIGVLMALSGQAFRMLVIGFAYITRGGRNKQVYAESLVQSGFYAHTRNPMYVGNYLILVGFVLLHGSLWAYLIILPFFTMVYYSIVVNEESYLAQKFAEEYRRYTAKVNRFIPSFKGITETLQGSRYNWKKALSKEYGTIALVLSGLIALLIWKKIALLGYGWEHSQIKILAWLFLPILIFYGVTRYLKKSRRL